MPFPSASEIAAQQLALQNLSKRAVVKGDAETTTTADATVTMLTQIAAAIAELP